VYEGEQVMTINGGESRVQTVDIPFGSAGVYEIMIEAMAQDQTLATTTIIAVEVPWLAADLYILVLIAAVVVGASIAYAMCTRLTGR
jgi:hypothetical protein